MSDDRNEQETLQRATTATQRRCTVRLDELKLLPERYCHRDEEELKPENLELFLDSLILEGSIRVAVVYSLDAQKQKVLISGHRRVIGCRTLADRNQPGFTPDMEVEAVEVLNATPLDLLIESVSDNENRKNLSPGSRLRTVKKLHDAGAEVKRAARALGVADSTYQRDLQIVKYGWMYQHVEDDSIAPTVANKILEAAEEAKRVKEVKEDLDEWIAAKKREIKDKARRVKAETEKELRPAELLVKNHMVKHLVDHWIKCIKDQRPFDDDVEWDFAGSIDKEGKLQFSALTLDLTKAPADDVIKVMARMSRLTQQMAPYAQERLQVERHRKQVDVQTAPYDFELLRKLGMTEQADRLEEKYRRKLEEARDGEDDAAHVEVEERREEDLAASIELPGATVAGEVPEASAPAPAEPAAQQSVAPPAEPPAPPAKQPVAPPVEAKGNPVAKKPGTKAPGK